MKQPTVLPPEHAGPPPEGRSPHWPAVERAHLAQHPGCAACGRTKADEVQIDVHHIHPFHVRPDLELEPSNLLTVCRPHHYVLGHLGVDWKLWNPDVEMDCRKWLAKVEAARAA